MCLEEYHFCPNIYALHTTFESTLAIYQDSLGIVYFCPLTDVVKHDRENIIGIKLNLISIFVAIRDLRSKQNSKWIQTCFVFHCLL